MPNKKLGVQTLGERIRELKIRADLAKFQHASRAQVTQAKHTSIDVFRTAELADARRHEDACLVVLVKNRRQNLGISDITQEPTKAFNLATSES